MSEDKRSNKISNDLGFGLNLSVKDTKKQNASYDTEKFSPNPKSFLRNIGSKNETS